MRCFGKVYIDAEGYIVVPVIINGSYMTDYEVHPRSVTEERREEWIEHFRAKDKIMKDMLSDFIAAYDYHLMNYPL